MTADDDIEGLAAEYVLGSLEPAERAQVAERRKRDPALDRAIGEWEARLAPLSERMPGIEPPAHLLESILRRISTQGGKVVSFSSTGRGRWRPFAIGASALAACIMLVVAWLTFFHTSNTLVAELRRSGSATADDNGATSTPAFMVTVDLAARRATVRPVAVRARPGRRYELWATRPGAAVPEPLGSLSPTEPVTVSLPAGYGSGDLLSATLAVSLEPEGSPRGERPAGPIVYTGKLVAGP